MGNRMKPLSAYTGALHHKMKSTVHHSIVSERKSIGNLSSSDPWACPECQGHGALLPGTPQETRCSLCVGAGIICPMCQGARWLRIPRQNKGNDVYPCTGCCDAEWIDGTATDNRPRWKAIYEPEREAATIRRQRQMQSGTDEVLDIAHGNGG